MARNDQASSDTPEPTSTYKAKTSSGIEYDVRLSDSEAERLGFKGGAPDEEAFRADADSTAEPAVSPAETSKARTASANKARSDTDTK